MNCQKCNEGTIDFMTEEEKIKWGIDPKKRVLGCDNCQWSEEVVDEPEQKIGKGWIRRMLADFGFISKCCYAKVEWSHGWMQAHCTKCGKRVY